MLMHIHIHDFSFISFASIDDGADAATATFMHSLSRRMFVYLYTIYQHIFLHMVRSILHSQHFL